MELKNGTTKSPPLFLCYKPSVQAIFRFILFYRKGTSKSKNRKTCCKNNKIYLFRTEDSHFVNETRFSNNFIEKRALLLPSGLTKPLVLPGVNKEALADIF